MAIVKRLVKGSELTHAELDGNFTDLDGRVTTAQQTADANNYVHPTGDGNKHVPTNGTTNGGKVLTAGATAGVYTWNSLSSGVTDHVNLSNIGTKTHATLDSEVDINNAKVSNVAHPLVEKAVPTNALFTDTDTVYNSTGVDNHIADTTTNPHNVDKTDVGLGDVDNTSDASKPVSTAQQTESNTKLDKSVDIQILWSGTQAEYDAIGTPSTTTIYFIE